PPPASAPLFPYTTLFRSQGHAVAAAPARTARRRARVVCARGADSRLPRHAQEAPHAVLQQRRRPEYDTTCRRWLVPKRLRRFVRSEEHTSELQSRFDLVC